MRAATLMEHLAAWSDDRLGRLLVLRPDLCHPPVPDFAALAARATTQMSVLRALDRLDRARLDVLSALAAGPDTTPAATRVAAAFDHPDPETVASLMERLAEAALVVWHHDDWHLPAAVAAALTPSARPSPTRTLEATAPAPTGRTVPAALSRNAALAAIGDLLRAAETLLDALSPGLATLRSGGVGVREVRRLADATGSDPVETAWLLELLVAAGLVILDPDTSRWRPTTGAATAWRRLERHRQWAALVEGWLGSGRAPMHGPPPADPTGRAEPTGRALAGDRARPDGPRLRRALLEAAHEVDRERPGTALDPAVAARQRWRAPRQAARTTAFTPALLTEAERLGLTGAGALTEPGALVAAGDLEQAAAAVGNALPAPLTRVRLQGDLTAVAPGFLDPEVARRLASMAEVEGDGTARVYRFTDASLHAALDAGDTAAGIEQFLAEHSEDEVPQALRYLVRDVDRRHGVLTAGAAAAWLRSEDEDLLDVIVADPAMSPAELERLAPTVVVAGVGPRDLHRLLAEAGHRAALRRTPSDPVDVPGAGGTVGADAGAPSPRRDRRAALADQAGAHPFPDPVRTTAWGPDSEELAAQIARLRAAPRPVPSGPGPEEAVAVLRAAARQQARVDLVTVDQRGSRRSHRVVPLAVAGGRVRCLVPDRDAEIVVPLHRVVSASTVEGSPA